MIFVAIATKNGRTKKNFSPSYFGAVIRSATLRIRIHRSALWYDPWAAPTWTETLHPGLAAAALRVNFHVLLDASRCDELNKEKENSYYEYNINYLESFSVLTGIVANPTNRLFRSETYFHDKIKNIAEKILFLFFQKMHNVSSKASM